MHTNDWKPFQQTLDAEKLRLDVHKLDFKLLANSKSRLFVSGTKLTCSSSVSEAGENDQNNAPAYEKVSCLSTNSTLRRNRKRKIGPSDPSLNQPGSQSQAACREKANWCRAFINLNISFYSEPKDWTTAPFSLINHRHCKTLKCQRPAEVRNFVRCKELVDVRGEAALPQQGGGRRPRPSELA